MSATILASSDFQYNGIPGLSLVDKVRTRTGAYGYGWELTFEGTEGAVNAAFLSLPEDCDAKMRASGPFHQLIVSYSTDPAGNISSQLSNSFELLGNNNQFDILEHPKALDLPRATVENVIRLVSKTELTDDEEAEAEALAGDAGELYDYLKRRSGSGSFEDAQFVFRATIIASRRSTVNIAFANDNRLYTFAQLKNEANPPTGYIFSLDAIEASCAPAIVMDGHAWRWKKGTPSVTSAPGNRVAIQIDWTLAVWNTWVYRAAA